MAFVDDHPAEARVTRACYAVSLTALAIGGLFGLIQALHRTGLYRDLITSVEYYSVLTGHGVLLALVFTIFGLCALYHWGTTRSLDQPVRYRWFSWLWFGLMLVGAIMATIAILGGLLSELDFSAAVLYTFYAPLEAHPLFYAGLALFVVGTWLAGVDWFWQYFDWRAGNPDARIPLQTFMILATMIMWYIASVSVAAEILVFLLPWSLGVIDVVDPLLTRTMFWYFGHPVVYFWLLPAYFLWYSVLPKLSGGRLFSDPLARVVFVLFILLSTPVGFHHQFLDPGIAEGFKFIAMTNTMFLLLPSLLTAFTVIASIEHGGRQLGGEGYLGWLTDLPWGDAAFAGMVLSGLMFAAGGFSGMVNAGMNINYLVHNTLWVPGHFHLMVGTASALTMMAGSYWLLPQVTGNRLRFRGVALVQPYLWFVGVTFLANAMFRAGLAGVPRRTAVATEYRFVEFQPVLGDVTEMRLQMGLGAALMFTSLLFYLFVVLATWFTGRDGPIEADGSIPPALSGPEQGPEILDNLKLWTGLAILLVVLAYGVAVYGLVANGPLVPGLPPVQP